MSSGGSASSPSLCPGFPHDRQRTDNSREAQTWGGGRQIISEADRKSIKKARKEGRVAEAMLDRRSALKRWVRGVFEKGRAGLISVIDTRGEIVQRSRDVLYRLVLHSTKITK